MNLYQLCITDAAKKYAAKKMYAIVLTHFTGSPPCPCSASGTSPLFPFIKANCLSAPGPGTRSVAKAHGGGYSCTEGTL
jgi:hypothetical protein